MESPYKAFARPGYLLALLLFVLPIFDAFVSIWPIQFGEERWRFAAIGAFSNQTLLPLLGLLCALLLATALDDRRMRRGVAWVCAICSGILVAAALLFILDYLQTRAMVRVEYKSAMDVAAAASFAKQILTIVTLIFLSAAGLKGARAERHKKGAPRRGPTPLIPLAKNAQSE